MQFQRLVAASVLSIFFPVSAALAEGNSIPAHEVRLVIDFVGILHIEGGMNTIAVGNSDIATATLADERTVILTGRTPGTTNLIALDDAGRVIADVIVHVSSQKPGMVTVRRGMQMQAYDCGSGLCKGDGTDPLMAVLPVAAAPTE